ncbi:G patch domain-containing protein 4 [Parambassis ranga]|uniref:G patch domain-containing protein 4 n=1 Tax=Parambassis ranga TaxID=210632 RepID=A0A6P7JYT2_9TELE|nr:G patch domain-containing protein 4 [Parambassis ranga]
MAAGEAEKSRGLKFAEQQLLRHGWEHGKGLGRAENGISEALKVKVKCDKGGVGHKEGDQFTFHWWDHVFNKASSSLQVESDQNGIKLKKTAEDDEDDGTISNKKPRKASLAKDKLYGCFVKSATLWSGQEQPEPKSNSDDDDSSSSSEEEDQRLDLSSTTKLSDCDLMKACGGRTAHKGARHGLTMSAKLARLEQQEAEFMAKWGKKSQSASSSPTPPTSQSDTQEETADCGSRDEKKKKKKGKPSGDEMCDSPETKIKKKKKTKSKMDEDRTDVSTEGGLTCEEHSDTTKRKHKKKKKEEEDDVENSGDKGTDSAAAVSPEEADERHADLKEEKKKKKKKKASRQEEQSNQSDPRTLEETEAMKSKEKKKKKKSKKDKLCEEEEEHPPQKKKKKKCRD